LPLILPDTRHPKPDSFFLSRHLAPGTRHLPFRPFCFWPHVSAIIAAVVKTTRYFEEQVLRKRPYIQREWCERIIANPLKKEIQPDGRIRHWGTLPELAGRALRVV
jgi:hypothetical protein